MLTKEEVSKLLGRSLSSNEDTNFDLYIKIATERIEDLLCMSLCGDCDSDARIYEPRFNYQTLFIDPFTDLVSVTINDTELEESSYTVKQNDKYNGSWYNSIEFKTPMRSTALITVDAEWGFDELPVDLQLLIARMFAQFKVETPSTGQVKSKKIEDFTVTYKDAATMNEFVSSNKLVVDKYSLCNVGRITHGRVRPLHHYGLHFPKAGQYIWW